MTTKKTTKKRAPKKKTAKKKPATKTATGKPAARKPRTTRSAAAPDAVARPPDSGPIVLPAELAIDGIAAAHATLAGIATDDAREIDGDGVLFVDTAGLQLLAAFCTTHGNARWVGVSGHLRTRAELLGLTATLRLPTPAADVVKAEDDLCPVF